MRDKEIPVDEFYDTVEDVYESVDSENFRWRKINFGVKKSLIRINIYDFQLNFRLNRVES